MFRRQREQKGQGKTKDGCRPLNKAIKRNVDLVGLKSPLPDRVMALRVSLGTHTQVDDAVRRGYPRMAFDWRMRDPDHQTNIESRRYIDDMIYNGRAGTVVVASV